MLQFHEKKQTGSQILRFQKTCQKTWFIRHFHEKLKMNAVADSGGGVGGETPTAGKQQIVQGGKRKVSWALLES